MNEWASVVCRTEDSSPPCTGTCVELIGWACATHPTSCVCRRRCMRYVRIQRPPIVLFENVPTVATKFKEDVLQPMIQMLELDGAQLV